jgi:hypothetical protein
MPFIVVSGYFGNNIAFYWSCNGSLSLPGIR